MNRVHTATTMLRDLEAMLRATPRGAVDPLAIAEKVATVLALLSTEEARWVGTTEAKRLLGVGSENTVKAWARLGPRLRPGPHPTQRTHTGAAGRRVAPAGSR